MRARPCVPSPSARPGALGDVDHWVIARILSICCFLPRCSRSLELDGASNDPRCILPRPRYDDDVVCVDATALRPVCMTACDATSIPSLGLVAGEKNRMPTRLQGYVVRTVVIRDVTRYNDRFSILPAIDRFHVDLATLQKRGTNLDDDLRPRSLGRIGRGCCPKWMAQALQNTLPRRWRARRSGSRHDGSPGPNRAAGAAHQERTGAERARTAPDSSLWCCLNSRTRWACRASPTTT